MGDFIKTLTSLIGSIKAKVDGKIGILQKRIDDIPTETVLYTPQTLTEEQKQQARDNIGANDDAGSMFITITKSTQNGETVYSADKTYDEIVEAVKNGVVPVCNWIDPENTSVYGPQNIRCTYVNTFNFPGVIEFADFLAAGDDYLYNVRINRSNKVQIETKHREMTGATADNPGTGGTVPMPDTGNNTKFLRGDARWADVPKYELPVAANEQLGGVKPVAKTDAMTQDVGVDENGKLYTTSSSGGNSFVIKISPPEEPDGAFTVDKTSSEIAEALGNPNQYDAIYAIFYGRMFIPVGDTGRAFAYSFPEIESESGEFGVMHSDVIVFNYENEQPTVELYENQNALLLPMFAATSGVPYYNTVSEQWTIKELEQEPDVLKITCTQSGNSIVADKTDEEIDAASKAGKLPFVVFNSACYYPNNYSTTNGGDWYFRKYDDPTDVIHYFAAMYQWQHYTDNWNGRLVPAVTASDNGKFLRVVNGVWAASEIQNANGEDF